MPEQHRTKDILIGVMTIAMVVVGTVSFQMYRFLNTEVITIIPAEEKAKIIDQSYSTNLSGQKQLTIVIQSTKTVKENYDTYFEYFTAQNWNVDNKYESSQASSLHAKKDGSEMSVTISAYTGGSKVSISVLYLP